MANLLVTGGAGFIGANFVQYWAKQYPQDRIVILDALTYAGNLASLQPVSDHKQYRFVKGDIVNKDAVAALLREEQIDTIVHFAAESHVDRYQGLPLSSTQTLLELTICFRRLAASGWTAMTHRLAIGFIMSQPTKCTALLGRLIPVLMNRRRMHRVHHTRRVKQHQITLCVPTTILMACRFRPVIVQTTTGRTNFPKNLFH